MEQRNSETQDFANPSLPAQCDLVAPEIRIRPPHLKEHFRNFHKNVVQDYALNTQGTST